MSTADLIAAMGAPAPAFDAAAAARVAESFWGLSGRCELLYGERDLNFCLTKTDGDRHLLKLWNRTQDPAVVDFQMQALRHIERADPGLPVPRVELSLAGRVQEIVDDPDDARHVACMLSWREGSFLRDTRPSDRLKARLGRALARLDLALAAYQHPAQHRDMFWDLSRADRLRPLAKNISDPALLNRVLATIDEFESATQPMLGDLRKQVIHQDFHLDNVLIDPEDPDILTGILDFGDALYSPLVCDLGVACAYQLADGADPLAGILPMVQGYHRVLPLRQREQQVLAGLVRARLVSSVVITSHMALLHPVNREYLLIDTGKSAHRLERLSRQSLGRDTERIVEACLRAEEMDPEQT
jgi:Ser/Thr protein kinase RdoA (MazF antagonist)